MIIAVIFFSVTAASALVYGGIPFICGAGVIYLLLNKKHSGM